MRTLTTDGTMYAFTLADSHDSFLAAIPSTALHALLIAGAIVAGRVIPEVTQDPGPPLIAWQVATQPRTAATTTMSIPVAPQPTELCQCPIEEIPPVDLPPGTTTVIDPRILSTIPGGIPGTDSTGPVVSATVLTESEVDDLPVLLTAGALRYPAVLAAARISGSVTLEFVIDIEGRVASEGLRILSATHQGFVAAAQEAVQTTRFRPAKKNGQTVPVRVRQTVTFRP